jgi:hypothetical protein
MLSPGDATRDLHALSIPDRAVGVTNDILITDEFASAARIVRHEQPWRARQIPGWAGPVAAGKATRSLSM